MDAIFHNHDSLDYSYDFLQLSDAAKQRLQEFNGPFIVIGRGPLNATYLSSMFIYDKAFKEFDMGYASAASWVLFALIVCSTIILFQARKDGCIILTEVGNRWRQHL